MAIEVSYPRPFALPLPMLSPIEEVLKMLGNASYRSCRLSPSDLTFNFASELATRSV